MTNQKYSQTDTPVGALKNESARQRWELFHRAIAHAKQLNNSALLDAESSADDAEAAVKMLSIVR